MVVLPLSMALAAVPKQTLAPLSTATPIISAVLSLSLQPNEICDEMQGGLGVQDEDVNQMFSVHVSKAL